MPSVNFVNYIYNSTQNENLFVQLIVSIRGDSNAGHEFKITISFTENTLL